MKTLLFSLIFWIPSAFAAKNLDLSQAIKLNVEKYSLPNGLTVLLHVDHSIPAISLQTWFRVGSKDEKVGRAGLAHFFEHMMFKGTTKFPKETFGRFLNSKGAETNAFTSNDFTGYYINLPSEHMDLALQIESDRMRNLLLDPKEVNSEREVVKEERRMRYDDSIDGGIREKMSEIMYTTLPYKWLPIGSMADLNAASMEDLHSFYKTYYSPGNAVLVLAGDFDPSVAKQLIEKYYGKLSKEIIPAGQVTPEKEQTEVRRAVIEREAQSPTVAVAYRLPDLKSPDHFALDLLSVALGYGESSRLYKRMVYHDEMAMAAGAYSYAQVLAGSFNVNLRLKPGVSPDKALGVLEQEIAKARAGKITQKELEKARNMFLRDRVDSMKKIAGRANMIAQYEILYGDYRLILSEMETYQKVTAADIQAVAKKYLTPNRRNIVIVTPKKGGAS